MHANFMNVDVFRLQSKANKSFSVNIPKININKNNYKLKLKWHEVEKLILVKQRASPLKE